MFKFYTCPNCGEEFKDWFHTVQCPNCNYQTLSYIEMLHFRIEAAERRIYQLNKMLIRQSFSFYIH